MEVLNMIINLLFSLAVALLFSPLLCGIINRIKALFAGRKGAPLLQMYFDLYRLFRKQTLVSRTTTLVFLISPVIIFVTSLSAVIFVPILPGGGYISFTGDFILLFYLLGLGRFFLVISALDTGSPFEGMGASREVFFSAMAEPVIFIAMLTILRLNGAESFTEAISTETGKNWIILALTAIPLFIVMLAENARLPFDDPNTHLELTMIHEVMILDNSGPGLALLEWAAAIKLWLFSLIIVKILLPVTALSPGIYFAVTILSVLLISMIVGVVESVLARSSLPKVPQLLFSSGIIAFLGFFLSFSNFFVW
ncbi:MAG: NADH-quinone oxidoreductase subunit H [Spirochaetales bacterium]|nr:NADH-quinone oxidoreductase subunit H [Spirochaetales bacterium]